MSSTAKEKTLGPIEDQAWAEKILSRTVTPGPQPRIHGYDVESDLLPNYGFADVLVLSVLGDLPGDAERRAIEIAMQVLAPVTSAAAPSHAAMLVRLCGATTSAAFAAGAFALAEEARFTVQTYEPWLDFLRGGTESLPVIALATSESDAKSVATIRMALAETGLSFPELYLPIGKTAAAFAVLHACGARENAMLELLLLLSRLPCVGAEVLATKPTEFRGYPINLPPFELETTHAKD